MSDEHRSRNTRIIAFVVIGAAAFLGCCLFAPAVLFLVGTGGVATLVKPSVPPPHGAPVAGVSSAPHTSISKEGAFFYADVTASSGSPPAAFSRPLPSSVEEWDDFEAGDPRFVPYPHVRDRACAGDASTIGALVGFVRAASASGASAEDLEYSVGVLFEECTTHAPCEALRTVVMGTETAIVKSPFWHGLAYACTDDTASIGVIEGPSSPDKAYLAWIGQRRYRSSLVPWAKRIADAGRAAAATGQEYELQIAAEALGQHTDARAASSLAALHAAARPYGLQDIVALEMGHQTDARLRTLFTAACDRDSSCEPPDPLLDLTKDPFEDLMYELEMQDVVQANVGARRGELLDALARCASASRDYESVECHDWLARLDWSRAGSVQVDPGRYEAEGRELVQVLKTFESRDAVIERFHADGVLRAGDPSPSAASPRRILAEARRGAVARVEKDYGTFAYDSLLRELSMLARPELDSTLFQQTFSAQTGGPSPPMVQAWQDGDEFSFRPRGENLSDVPGCVAFLNTLLRERGSKTRLVIVESPDIHPFVVAAPAESLARLHAEGILKLPSGKSE